MSSRRTIAVIIAVLCTGLGITAFPATAAPAQTTGTSALNQVTFTSVNSGLGLDVQNGTAGDGSIIVTNSAPGYDQAWHLNTGAADSSFTIVNNTTGKCVDAGLPLRQQPCDGRTGEKWYFQPVAGSKAFMIRQNGDNTCLDVLLGAKYNDAWTNTQGCNGSAAQQWTLPADAYQAAWNMAVDHAAARCSKDASTCTWSTGTQAPAAPLPRVCVSPVWYNGTAAPVPWTFSLVNHSGWSSTIGFTLSGQLGGGTDVLKAQVTATVNGSVTVNVSQDLGNSLTVTVPPKQYGWVALSELATKVTGNWTFDAQGFAWTADDTVTVPLRNDDNGGASVYLAQTSPTFTSCSS